MKKRTKRETEPGREECLAMARSCLSANLRRTERLITRHYDDHLADTGITAVQLPLLATIASASDPTFGVLAKTLELDRSTLSRNLAILEQRELVEIGSSSGPKPGVISLTRKGSGVLRRAHRRWTEAQRSLEEAMSSGTITRALGALKTLRSGVRNITR